MPTYAGNQAAFTPSTTQNWVLWANDANDSARVTSVNWGGEANASLPSRTRWVRPTTDGSGTVTGIGTVQSTGLLVVTAGCVFATLATPPTNPAVPGGLFGVSWNAFGGLGRYNLDDREVWEILNGVTARTQIVCLNDINTTATSMSCGVVWLE